MGIKVVATQKGYYKRTVEIGALFEIEDEKHFSKRWMKRFDPKVDKTAKPAPAKPPKRAKKVAQKPVEPETLKDVTDNTPKDEDWV